MSTDGVGKNWREPLGAAQARPHIRLILERGRVVFSGHAREEMEKDGLTEIDCTNILRAGVVEEPHYENGQWRYRVRSSRMSFVIRLVSSEVLVVITGWRERP